MSLEGVKIHLIDSIDEAAELKRWLGTVSNDCGCATAHIGFDTETTGLSPERDRVRLAQVSDDYTAWVIPFERWGGVVEEIVKRWDGRYDMHNAPYDRSMCRREGIEIPIDRIDDTRLMGHVIEPTESTALKNQASRHVDSRAGALQRRLDDIISKRHGNGYWSWATIPIAAEGPLAVYWQYAGMDPILTRQLKHHHWPIVQRESPLAYDLELGTAWVTEKMERNGSVIDREYTAARSDELSSYVQECEHWTVANYDVKPGSNDKVIEVLAAETGYQFTKRTDSGRGFALDKEVLEDVIRQTGHPLAETVLSRRRAQKIQSTFLRRFLEYSEFDGLLHPHINSIGGSGKSHGATEGLYGVRTGRMSMDSPNLQQLPRRSVTNPFANLVRNCVVARPGHVLIMCDFDQIEFRVLAHLARDPGMIAAFGQETDFFTTMARLIYHDPSIAKNDPRRQTTKNGHYAIAYAAGLDKFALTAGITNAEAAEFLSTIHSMFPGIKRFQRQVYNVAAQRLSDEGVAYVRSPMTRRKHIADDGKDYTLLNYLIQGLAAEILKLKLMELDAAGLGQYLVLPVHDEVILDVPLEEVPAVTDQLRVIMNDDKLFSVPITAGVSRGDRWGMKEEMTL